jgi:hypothetical protein
MEDEIGSYVARMRDRTACRDLVGKPEGIRSHLEDQDVDGIIIPKDASNKQGARLCSALIGCQSRALVTKVMNLRVL